MKKVKVHYVLIIGNKVESGEEEVTPVPIEEREEKEGMKW